DLIGRAERQSRVLTVTSLVPLVLEGLAPERAARLIELLTDPATFWLPWPVPSVAASEPAFDPAPPFTAALRAYTFPSMPNRWLPVLGGILMNLALGSLYAWSVFVPPLEREFGWNRAQTSWVYTIAIVCFALTFVVAGRIQDVKGPRLCAFLGGLLVSAGFVLASFTTSLLMLYIFYGVI